MYTNNNDCINKILEDFKIIIETFKDVDDIIEYCELQGVTEDDKAIIKEKIDDYIEKM